MSGPFGQGQHLAAPTTHSPADRIGQGGSRSCQPRLLNRPMLGVRSKSSEMSALLDSPDRLLSGARLGIAVIPDDEPTCQLRAPLVATPARISQSPKTPFVQISIALPGTEMLPVGFQPQHKPYRAHILLY